MTIRNHFTQGSPPLARGIQQQAHMGTQYHGITPACAGNTDQSGAVLLPFRDHPRLRGEYRVHPRVLSGDLGSPPLARGIH